MKTWSSELHGVPRHHLTHHVVDPASVMMNSYCKQSHSYSWFLCSSLEGTPSTINAHLSQIQEYYQWDTTNVLHLGTTRTNSAQNRLLALSFPSTGVRSTPSFHQVCLQRLRESIICAMPWFINAITEHPVTHCMWVADVPWGHLSIVDHVTRSKA